MARLQEKIGYGLGDMSSSMFWKIFSYYLPFFYSNVFGLSLEHAAMLLLVTKLWDAVSDPVMGIVADRTSTRWGKFRPYLLWAAVPFAVAGVLTFTTPAWGEGGKLVWAYATYIVMMTVYTVVNVPYGAMLGVMTDDPQERTVFSSYRMFFAYGGSFLALAVFEPLCNAFAGVGLSQQQAWQYAVGVVGTACMLLFFGCFALTREHVRPAADGRSSSVLRDLRALAANGPWWWLLGAAIAALLFNSIRGGAAAYYFKDYVGEGLLGGGVVLTAGLFLSVGEIANMAGVVLAVPVSRRIGKKNAYILAMAGSAVLSAAFCYVPLSAGGFRTMLLLQAVISVFAGMTFPLLWSMYADVADYSEYRHGSGSTGLIFSSSSMAQKFGGAFGSALILWLLAAYGYDTSASAVQTPEALTGLRMLMSWIPAVGCALAAAAVCGYPLTERRMASITDELEKRRQNR